jgi:uncharacterized repeat protein (TIGR01451 family)
MSNIAIQWRPLAIVIALFSLAVSLPSTLDGQRDRISNEAVSALGTTGSTVPPSSSASVANAYGKLPISFEMNQGQTDRSVQFLARGTGYTLFLRPGEAVLSLHAPDANLGRHIPPSAPETLRPYSRQAPSPTPASTVLLQLIGSNTSAEARGVDPLPGKSNYIIGDDPAKWHTDVPTYTKVRYSDVYPGVDLLYYGNREGRLEHDLVVAPGSDPNQIEFELRDQDRRAALKNGGLTLRTKSGDLSLGAPLAYQVIRGETKLVAASYMAAGSGHFRFRVGAYDNHFPLVIDPVLVFTAVFGGSKGDVIQAMTIDSERNVYVTGSAYSSDFPLVNPYQSSPGFTFVSKLNSSGTALVYSTYFGGEQTESLAIKVDAGGRAYVSGFTGGDIPILNAYQPRFGGGGYDAFLAVLNPEGNTLAWSTYLGGPGGDFLTAMALDSSGNVYLTGTTGGGFPQLHTFPGAQCATDGECIWVAKFNDAGTLLYSTLYSAGLSAAIAADQDGAAYITGIAYEPALTTPGAFRSTCTTAGCGFVAKISPIGDSLVYATTLGTIAASGAAIAVDSDLNAYVGGTSGPGLPVWSTGFQRTYGGGASDGMVIKVNAAGTDLIWSTYMGGSGTDLITGLALDQYRQVYISGYTTSPNFPLKSPIQSFNGNGVNPYQNFVAVLSPSLSSISYYSTYFGQATYTSVGYIIAVDPALNVYLAGEDQNNVPPTPGAYSFGSYSPDIFISKLSVMDDLSLALSASPAPVVQGSDLTYTISVTSKGPDFGVNVRVSDTLPTGSTFVGYEAGGGTCTAPEPGNAGTLNCTLPQLNKGATWTVNLTVKVNAAAGSTLSDTAATVSNMQDFLPGNNSGTITTRVD